MARADDEKLNALLKKQQGIQAKIAAVKAAQNAQARRDDTRLKVLVGAAVLSDAQRRPDVKPNVCAVLNRAITTDRDRDFLKQKGWL